MLIATWQIPNEKSENKTSRRLRETVTPSATATVRYEIFYLLLLFCLVGLKAFG
jgi:hypothetical protein